MEKIYKIVTILYNIVSGYKVPGIIKGFTHFFFNPHNSPSLNYFSRCETRKQAQKCEGHTATKFELRASGA